MIRPPQPEMNRGHVGRLGQQLLEQRNRVVVFFYDVPAPTVIYTLSLHDALPISPFTVATTRARSAAVRAGAGCGTLTTVRSEEHTSELQSQSNLVCRLLLEKKKRIQHRLP